MPFTRRKFLSLTPASRAKKLADLLARLIRAGQEQDRSLTGVDSSVTVAEYNTLAGWNQAESRMARPEDRRGWLALYHYWRKEAGLGPEKEVFAALERTAPGFARARTPALAYDVWLHDIRSGHNVGSILRTVDCLGLRGVHRSGYTPAPEQDAVRVAAMGCETYVPCRTHDSEREFFEWLAQERKRARDAGAPEPALIALETGTDAGAEPIDIRDYDWPASGVLVIGNEELGIDPEILIRCDAILAIRMRGRKASLNLANAFAIAAHELGRDSRS